MKFSENCHIIYCRCIILSHQSVDIYQVQRQLQLRIEAQGKYLKKIIEEQQRISGVLSDTPEPENNFLQSDDKNDPATPAPTSEPPFLDKPAEEHVPNTSLSVDESYSSHNEPQTPDSGCHVTSSIERPSGRPGKRQRANPDLAFTKSEMGLIHHSILESASSPSYQQPHSLFLAREEFDHS